MSENNPLRTWHFGQLRRSLHRLASTSSTQPALFPEWAAKPDDLAMEFDHWASFVRSTYAGDLSKEQTDALGAIEQKLATMSRDGAEFDVDLWTDTALTTSEHWAEVRRLAIAALDVFSWSESLGPEPPRDQHPASRAYTE